MQGSYSDLQAGIPDLETPEIETWEHIYPESWTQVKISTPEFTAVCPKTGLPDYAQIEITYIPHKSCIELKSLKEYYQFYRDIGIFHEHLANKILGDFVKACDPHRADIYIKMNVRGGITTEVSANYTKGSFEADSGLADQTEPIEY